MFDTSISMDQYQGVDGFGPPMDSEDINALNKALLTTGYDIANQTGGAALRPESLEGSLKVITHAARHLAFWKRIPKSPAFSTNEEFNRQQSYGARMGGFTLEGELPQESVSAFSRESAKVKYLGTTRGVSLQMSMVNPAHGDAITQATHDGIMYVLTQAELSLFNGDSSLTRPGSTGAEWDGLDRLIDPGNIVDAAGAPFTTSMCQDVSDMIALAGKGFPTDVFAGVKPLGDLVRSYYARERIALPAPVGGQVGNSVSTVATQNGVLQLNSDIFLAESTAPDADQQSSKAPTAPSSFTSDATGTDGEFAKTQGAGTVAEYQYCVTAGNRFGESTPVYLAAHQAMDLTGDQFHIDLDITNGSQNEWGIDYYAIYRTKPMQSGTTPVLTNGDEAKLSLVARLPVTAANSGGVNNYDDLNIRMPWTSTIYIGQLTPDVLTFRQLAPLMKLDLAVVTAARQWMTLLFGVPILFAPKRFAKIINVGTMS